MNFEYKVNSLYESNKVASLYSVRNRNLNKLASHLNIDSLILKFESLAHLANLYLYVQINLQKKK